MSTHFRRAARTSIGVVIVGGIVLRAVQAVGDVQVSVLTFVFLREQLADFHDPIFFPLSLFEILQLPLWVEC